jgi:hypothetical protein
MFLFKRGGFMDYREVLRIIALFFTLSGTFLSAIQFFGLFKYSKSDQLICLSWSLSTSLLWLSLLR